MAAPNPKQIARVDAICKNIEIFMRMRAREVFRIKPELGPAVAGLVWRKMFAVRHALLSSVTFGAEIYCTVDVLVSDDEAKKKILMDERRETSLFFQTVSSDDADQGPDGRIHIFDLHSCFARLDPQIGNLCELVIYWAWWDLPDAVDMYVFDQAVQRFEALRTATGAMPENVVQAYRVALGRPAEAKITREDMLACEADKCQRVLDRWAQRCESVQPYRILLGYEPGTDDSANAEDGLLIEIASHLTGIAHLQEQEELDPRAVDYYAERLNVPASAVTRENAVAYEKTQVQRLKGDLYSRISAAGKLHDQAYDYKVRMLDQLRKRLEDLRHSAAA